MHRVDLLAILARACDDYWAALTDARRGTTSRTLAVVGERRGELRDAIDAVIDAAEWYPSDESAVSPTVAECAPQRIDDVIPSATRLRALMVAGLAERCDMKGDAWRHVARTTATKGE